MSEAIEAPAPEATGAAEPESTQPESTPAPEASPVAPTEEPKKVRLSSQITALQKMEVAARKERESIAAERKSLEEARTQAEARAKLKKERPLDWLREEGLDYDALTEAVVQEGTPEAKLKAALEARLGGQSKQVEELQAKLEALEKEREADRVRASEAQAQAFRVQMETAIRGSEDFELTAADPQGMDTVFELIVESARRTGKLMPVPEAAAKVEAALRQRAEALLQTKFARGKLAPEVERAAPAATPRTTSPRTLTNSPAATTTAPKAPARRETREERLNRAIARLGG